MIWGVIAFGSLPAVQRPTPIQIIDRDKSMFLVPSPPERPSKRVTYLVSDPGFVRGEFDEVRKVAEKASVIAVTRFSPRTNKWEFWDAEGNSVENPDPRPFLDRMDHTKSLAVVFIPVFSRDSTNRIDDFDFGRKETWFSNNARGEFNWVEFTPETSGFVDIPFVILHESRLRPVLKPVLRSHVKVEDLDLTVTDVSSTSEPYGYNTDKILNRTMVEVKKRGSSFSKDYSLRLDIDWSENEKVHGPRNMQNGNYLGFRESWAWTQYPGIEDKPEMTLKLGADVLPRSIRGIQIWKWVKFSGYFGHVACRPSAADERKHSSEPLRTFVRLGS